jgi:protein-S-isoprenylcysteine O-methyltransferase Ste14
MSGRRAAIGSALFLLVAPGTVAWLVPWLLTGWESRSWPWPVRVMGALLLAAAVAALLSAFARFAREGIGTPAPIAPTQRLVVGGLYRYVRNPMYVAVASIIGGQALLFRDVGVLWWLLIFMAAVWSFVKAYEEPELANQFGESYQRYRDAVPGWWPRLTPYQALRSGQHP